MKAGNITLEGQITLKEEGKIKYRYTVIKDRYFVNDSKIDWTDK